MNPLLDIFKQFTEHYMQTNGWDSPASVWSWDDDSYQWQLVEDSYDDPYSLFPALVVHGYHGTAMFVVHGWGAPYDKNTESIRPSEHPEKVRIRALTYLNKEDVLTSYQIMGKPITEVDEKCEGVIIDTIIDGIKKMKSYLNNKEVYNEQD